MPKTDKGSHLVESILSNEGYLAAHVSKFFCPCHQHCSIIIFFQVLSSIVADALTFEDRDETVETRQFIRHMDMFFDCLRQPHCPRLLPEHCFSSAAEGGVQGFEDYECRDKQQHTTNSK